MVTKDQCWSPIFCKLQTTFKKKEKSQQKTCKCLCFEVWGWWIMKFEIMHSNMIFILRSSKEHKFAIFLFCTTPFKFLQVHCSFLNIFLSNALVWIWILIFKFVCCVFIYFEAWFSNELQVQLCLCVLCAHLLRQLL